MTPERDARIEEIVKAAQVLSGAERSAYLDRACAGDLTLRHRLDQLLDPDGETLEMTGPAGDGETLDFALAGPQIIDGRYRIERLLGRGGMGAVYLVRHVVLEKQFALKLILQDGGISQFHRESFESEARALGRLHHPNIVQVTDYGVDARAGGVPFLVMEYLVGQTLDEVLDARGSLPIEEALELLRAAAGAVDSAHNSGIVHGDLKPSNLLLAEDPDASRVCLKVLDFGLARLTMPGSAEPETSLGEKNFRGTPAYMAPELLRCETASPASDRFAFGALLYELLTGRAPFGRRLKEVVANVRQPPANPSGCSTLPADIDQPVLSLLNPAPQLRPASARAAVSAVARAWLRAKRRKWREREWPKRLALSAVASCLVVLISAALAQLRPARALEGRIADQRFALLPPSSPDPSLLLVSIDDATLDADQRPLTERADEFARMIDRIFVSGARAVAVDMLLPFHWSESQEFAKAMLSHADRLALALFAAPSGKMIGTECINRLTGYVLGPRRYADLFGLVNLEEDEDRTSRRARLLFIDQAGDHRQCFACRAVKAAFPDHPASFGLAPVWIDYSVRPRELAPISWKDVPVRLDAAPGLFRDKLVILGATFSGNGDEHRVPRVVSDKLVPGELVQALIANTILAGNPIREVTLGPSMAAAGLACFAMIAAALCFPHLNSVALTVPVILLSGCAGFAFWIFHSSRIMVAVVGPEVAILLGALSAWILRSRLSAYPAEP